MELRYDSWYQPLARVVALGPGSSTVEINGPDLHVKMGWAFDAVIPLSSIVGATKLTSAPLGRGVHTRGSGHWIVNGSGTGLVELQIDPAVSARAVGVGIKLRKLTVSVDDVDGLIAACPRA
jgi:hypothetical protein